MWQNIQHKNGDIDILPSGENHTFGSECVCEPSVEVFGANLIYTHNSFDHREVVEQAIAIMNGEE